VRLAFITPKELFASSGPFRSRAEPRSTDGKWDEYTANDGLEINAEFLILLAQAHLSNSCTALAVKIKDAHAEAYHAVVLLSHGAFESF